MPELPTVKPTPIPAPVQIAKTAFDASKAPLVATAPKAPITTNVFGSSATPTLSNRPASQVQTGGFGDPNGVPVSKNGNGTGREVTIATVGSFELPNGQGNGNGTGGKSGARGTIASTGFGNGVAAPPPQTAPRARVEQSQFNLATAEKHPSVVQPQHALQTPVSVVSKPRPIYTEEARRLHIEGEVLVNVVFTASGETRVIGVAKGLGHGLDEAAIAAAQQLKFKPATRDGVSVDSTATLHIVFALS
jgi:TonB family protein